MAVPGEALNTDRGDVAAKAAKTFDQRHSNPCACSRQGRCQTSGACANDQDIRMMNNFNLAGRLSDLHVWIHSQGLVFDQAKGMPCPIRLSMVRGRKQRAKAAGGATVANG